MALKRGARIGGGGFLDLRELADDGPVVCIFRICQFEPAEKATGFAGTNVPVISDVLICTGPRRGEVHLGERFIGAITGPLRGVARPNETKGVGVLPPETAVGDEIVLTVKVINRGKSNAGAVGDEPSDADYAAAEAVHAQGKGWETAGPDGAREPVGAGAGAASGGARKKPW